ncbi:CBS domain-containing protein [Desulfosporosinus sp. BICA1-9]|uniref:CBS domain-containing protein n=1 Tax=Desulfosporosinus sp. BICA1-9 TaxID=1531958 RepID=UPI00054C7BC3|nr:CBS domain-containing protein [Desulfosporosinus sp. BICA1-9]KJS50414.1 MAG: inosine-5'-monophosphate dehydrogenase [Peptococcaceae bacterium BRH_c23]KJS82248.1 MAG: inosine-5'-monophosphate dehydrogenase [Desulfosporosinus sp. BICA1-9]KJS88988.1 MAG: inosine-5'-monophosphate dehydrogenase [Desulfosporosinus sp. BICA1-9]HBW37980.1 CBS domain-containing protein [Desulfosporosinus sp.]
MKVREVMTTSVECAAPNTTVVELATMMKNNDIGSIPICEAQKVIGIITDRDIVLKAVADGKNIEKRTAKEVMNSKVITVTADQDVHEAASLMSKYQIRRLPVVEQGKLIGIVALGDLAIEKIHVNEAGDALSEISQGAHH